MGSPSGPIRNITIDGNTYTVRADANPSRDLGGFTKESQINGDGTVTQKMTPKPWMLEGLTVELDDALSSQEVLQSVIDSPRDVDITATWVNGVSYGGRGTITGDLKKASQEGTADITLSGGGKLKKL